MTSSSVEDTAALSISRYCRFFVPLFRASAGELVTTTPSMVGKHFLRKGSIPLPKIRGINEREVEYSRPLLGRLKYTDGRKTTAFCRYHRASPIAVF